MWNGPSFFRAVILVVARNLERRARSTIVTSNGPGDGTFGSRGLGPGWWKLALAVRSNQL